MFQRKTVYEPGPDDRCGVHQFDRASDRCRSCGATYCGDCLVYPHGARREPYCVRCALVAAGVRRPSRASVKVG